MALDYEQYLSEKLKALYFGNEKLCNLIQSDKELIFAVRKDEIHIYYLGGRILKITKSYDKLKFSFDWKYARKEKGSDEFNEYSDTLKMLNDNPYDVDLWIKHFKVLKHCMENFRKNVSHNAERQLQQELELANRDFNGEVIVVDNEYGVRQEHNRSSKLCKVDLVTIYKDSGKYKICLVELKRGGGAIGGKAGIAEHIGDFDVFLKKRKPDIIASINNLIEYKKSNHSLFNVPDGIKISEDTDICVSILCYDLPEQQWSRTLSLIEEKRKEINFDLHCNIKLNSKCLGLSKKDILG